MQVFLTNGPKLNHKTTVMDNNNSFFCCCCLVFCVVLLHIVTAHRGHEHYIPKPDEASLKDHRLTHDKEHIKEDIEAYFKMNFTLEQMSAKDMEYYYFVLHDFDKNNLLDGLEMLMAIQHIMEHVGDEDSEELSVEFFVDAIDMMLSHSDWNQDGFINYQEYVYAQQDATTTSN